MPLAVRSSEGLAVTRWDATDPVFWELMIAGHCVDEYAVVCLGVEDLEREVGNESAPRSSWRRLPVKRKGCGQLCGHLYFSAEAGAKTLANGFVVGGLGQQLGSRFSREAGLPHGAMRRASANTSSAAKVSTSPRA